MMVPKSVDVDESKSFFDWLEKVREWERIDKGEPFLDDDLANLDSFFKELAKRANSAFVSGSFTFFISSLNFIVSFVCRFLSLIALSA